MAFLIAWRAIWLPGIVVCGSFCSAEQQRRWVSESAANGRDFSVSGSCQGSYFLGMRHENIARTIAQASDDL